MSVKAIILLDEGSKTKGKVENLIEITAQAAIGFKLPAGRLMWDCGQFPVAIGDDWENGVFSREGEALEPVLTVEDRVNELEANDIALSDAMIANYEEQAEINASVETALIELYEMGAL